MRPSLALTIVFLAAATATNNCKCEAKKAMKAVDTFMGFSKGQDMTKEYDEVGPGYTLRHRSEEVVAGRSRITAEVEVGPGLDHATLDRVLRDACHDQRLHRGASVIRVIAWPGKLKRLGQPMGECVFARDGHGWEGTGVGFEDVRIRLPTAQKMKALGISGMTEPEYLRILGVENLLNRGKSRDQAIHQTAAHHDVHVQQVILAVEKAEKLWGKQRD